MAMRKGAIARQTGNREAWGKEPWELDKLDESIFKCIQKNPGLSVEEVRKCIKPRPKPSTIYYRIDTLEKGGYIRTVREGRFRKCYNGKADHD